MNRNFRSLFLSVGLFAAAFITSARGAMVEIMPSLDNSIYSESTNSNALGNLFSGRNNSNGIRRSLLKFDIAANVPFGAVVNSVSLGLYQLKHGSGSTLETFELHPLLKAWGEGTSSSSGGGGAAATTGDATWMHPFFSSATWDSPGSDFGPISGTGSIGIVDNTLYTFNSQPGMVADVQSWLNAPALNFGWLLKAAIETTPANAREFASGENINVSQWPILIVDFTAIPEPATLLLVGVGMVITFTGYRRQRGGVPR